VLFLRYEILHDSIGGERPEAAEFLGYPFTAAKLEAGMVDAVVELCRPAEAEESRGNMLEAAGALYNVSNGTFFRRGVDGDWSNHMTLDRAVRLDDIVETAILFLFPKPASAGMLPCT
jgi:hypothetical protein